MGEGKLTRMDIFYYSQSFEQNVKNGLVGLIGTNSPRAVELRERFPKRIWVFKSPKGMKGSVQLLASLLVSDEAKVAANTDHAQVIYYDPFSPESVIFTDSGSTEKIEALNRVLQYRFHAAFKSNFKGDAGLLALESNVVRELETVSADWAKAQMLTGVAEGKTVQPINPFAQPH
jgi:hypothetical protein